MSRLFHNTIYELFLTMKLCIQSVHFSVNTSEMHMLQHFKEVFDRIRTGFEYLIHMAAFSQSTQNPKYRKKEYTVYSRT